MRYGIRILLIAIMASLAVTLAVARLGGTRPAPAPGKRPTAAAAKRDSAIDWDATRGNRVLMLGRGFASDWFRHWGAMSPKEPVSRQGLTIVLGDLEREPGGAKAAAGYLTDVPDGVVAFFMLGPESLEGGSKERARRSVDRALAEVDAYADLAHSAGCRLVVGGPLPSLPSDTDRHLVDAQRRYRDELRERHRLGSLVLFDAYEHMSTPGDVTLVRGYALTQAESRLGGGGYAALDELFFPFMQARF